MKVVLDTNVIVSGFLSPFGPCGEIVCMVTAGEIQLCYDARILAEYGEVLRRPLFKIDRDDLAAVLDYIESAGQSAAPTPLPHSMPRYGEYDALPRKQDSGHESHYARAVHDIL